MKILIISHRAYPNQGPRAFRTTELSEQLAKEGHNVVLYSVHGTCNYSEYEKETGVSMKDIKPLLPLAANDGINRENFIFSILFKAFHNLFLFPEIEFYYKVLSIIKKESDADVLITIAVPHTLHMGAERAKRLRPDLFPRVWIADCGDPFFLNPFNKYPKYMEKWERKWCEAVNYITVPAENSINGYFPEYREKIRIIPQGFDFAKTPISLYQKNTLPTFIYTGAIYPGVRDIHSFMDYLLTVRRPYKFKMYMRVPLEQRYEIESNHQIEYVIGKTRAEIVMECSKADFLINIKNPNSMQTPSKLIDYGISRRPVLDISNSFCEQEQFNDFCRGDYHNQHILPNIEQYKIENVVKEFIKLIKNENTTC